MNVCWPLKVKQRAWKMSYKTKCSLYLNSHKSNIWCFLDTKHNEDPSLSFLLPFSTGETHFLMHNCPLLSTIYLLHKLNEYPDMEGQFLLTFPTMLYCLNYRNIYIIMKRAGVNVFETDCNIHFTKGSLWSEQLSLI